MDAFRFAPEIRTYPFPSSSMYKLVRGTPNTFTRHTSLSNSIRSSAFSKRCRLSADTPISFANTLTGTFRSSLNCLARNATIAKTSRSIPHTLYLRLSIQIQGGAARMCIFAAPHRARDRKNLVNSFGIYIPYSRRLRISDSIEEITSSIKITWSWNEFLVSSYFR